MDTPDNQHRGTSYTWVIVALVVVGLIGIPMHAGIVRSHTEARLVLFLLFAGLVALATFGLTTLSVKKAPNPSPTATGTPAANAADPAPQVDAGLEADVAIGSRIQQMLLLGRAPLELPGLRVAVLTIPSQQVDGDFYEFFEHEDQRLDLIVADVMGKGIPAALLGAATKSHFLEALCHLMAMSRTGSLSEPKEIVTLAHAEMARHLIELESFVTLCYSRFDLNRRTLDFVDCGHTGIIRFRPKTGFGEILHGNNLPLGIHEGEIYEQFSVSFEPDDLFLYYSDGITEARNTSGELFGTARLTECVRTHGGLEPDGLVAAIRDAVLAFSRSMPLTDDLTCVAIRIVEWQAPLGRAEMEIHSALADLRQARQFARTMCLNLPGVPFEEHRIAEFELAVDEAASNIVKHAYHGRPDQWIQLEAEAFPDRVTIRLHHLGDPFDASNVQEQDARTSQGSGLGLSLIKRCVDEVRYYRDGRGRNCVALSKRRGADSEA